MATLKVNQLNNLLIALFALTVFISCNSEKKTRQLTNQRIEDFNFNWSFHLSEKDISFSDVEASSWRKVQLPHDWVVEEAFDSTLVYNANATGYLPSEGYGFYQKSFNKEYKKDEVTYVLFDGVYNNAEVFINGNKLGFHPYGYSPFYYNITEYLNKNGKENVLEVKIDHSRYADSRWYTGAGIYRNVKLITANKLHIPVWGTFVTTPEVSSAQATVSLNIDVKNDFSSEESVEVETKIFDAQGNEKSVEKSTVAIKGNSLQTVKQNLTVQQPKLWSIHTPNLHKAVTTILKNGKVVDQYTTKFGIRSFKFDTNKGFFLNGENMKIKGVCIHHDGGLVGSAVPKGVWKRRLQTLKNAGCNAVRISHNPASDELLDLCDEMGILVQDELFDEWDNPKDKRFNQNEKSVDYVTRGYGEHFQEWAKKDLYNVIVSHRNHPSIIQWSIGNEIEWTYPRNAAATGFFNNMSWKGNYFWSEPPFSVEEIKHQLDVLPKGKYDIGKTAQKLSKWVKELDVTRPITANLILPSASHLSGYTDALDVIGYSYRRVLYDYGHKNYPDKPIMGTENLGQYHEWKAVAERPFIAGLFIWTGFDYMGEIRSPWPVRVQPSGLLNSAGFEKGSYHMMKTLWSDKPHIHIATQKLKKSLYKINAEGTLVSKKKDGWKTAVWEWQDVNEHWNYNEGENIVVEIYSNCEEIDLTLNGKSLGVKKLADFEDHIYKWVLPFVEGELVATATNKDGSKSMSKLVTARKATEIKLTTNEAEISANNYDVAHIIAELTDGNGNPVRTDNKEITFEIKGNVKLLGVDNGWKKNVQKFQSNKNETYNGKTLLIIQATDKKEVVEVVASGEGLTAASIKIKIN